MDLIFILLTQLINETSFDLDFEVVDYRRRLLPQLPPGKTRFAKENPVLRCRRRLDPGWKFRVMRNGEFTGIEMDPEVILDYVRVVFRVDADVLCVHGAREKRRRAFDRYRDAFFRHRYFGCMRNFYWDSRPLEPIYRSDTKLATKLRNSEAHCQHLAPFVDDLQNRNEEDENKGSKAQQASQKPMIDPRPPNPPEPKEKAKNVTTAESRQDGTRDATRHLDPQVKSRERVGIDDNVNDINTPRPPAGIGGNGIGRLRPYDVAAAQRAWAVDDESSTNVVEKDSFVHGMLLIFALIVFIWMRFF